jgi:hypothetical protein
MPAAGLRDWLAQHAAGDTELDEWSTLTGLPPVVRVSHTRQPIEEHNHHIEWTVLLAGSRRAFVIGEDRYHLASFAGWCADHRQMLEIPPPPQPAMTQKDLRTCREALSAHMVVIPEVKPLW